ncbi:hypothetical protein AB0K98_19100 [Streptomyces werraensis]|uniref:hypothetical protein n=1 Tax=Streptomyces werraensis TaxID=68284 RepID=UPI003447291B
MHVTGTLNAPPTRLPLSVFERNSPGAAPATRRSPDRYRAAGHLLEAEAARLVASDAGRASASAVAGT